MLARPFLSLFSKRHLPTLFTLRRKSSDSAFHAILKQNTTRLTLISGEEKRQLDITQGKTEIKNLFQANNSLHSQFIDTLEFSFSHDSEKITIAIPKTTIQNALNQSQQQKNGKIQIVLSQSILKEDLITSMLFGAQYHSYEIALTFNEKQSIESIRISKDKKLVFLSEDLHSFKERDEQNVTRKIS